MSLRAQAPVESRPLMLVEREALRPGPHEILVRVEVCAVCRTDLHVIEGDLALRRPGLVPGHQVVGSVAELGAAVKRFRVGDRVGIAYVFSRGGEHRSLAQELGATWVGDSLEPSPRPLDGAILFAPAGDLVPPALEALDRGATLAIAGIHLSDVPALDYQRHLFQERCIRSVTANTRKDACELLELAAAIPIRTRTQAYPLEAANEALVDLKHDRVRASAVLAMGA